MFKNHYNIILHQNLLNFLKKNKKESENNKPKMSHTRKIYFLRLLGRCIIFLLCLFLFFSDKTAFDIIQGWNFFEQFSILHILWGIWICDMICQLIPVKAHISIGSQKQFSVLFRPIKEKINYQNLKKYIADTTKSAYKVMILWIIVNAIIGFLYTTDKINTATVFLISVFFYVCDLICVLIWCPFRLIMSNKCCTTCRIFNWDHLMMFAPFITVKGFYTYTLVILSIIIWLVWEICVFTYPERFWEKSNMALKCSECTDKLCTQYCRKLRK